MKTHSFGIAVATLFLTMSPLPGRADDTSTAPTSAPAQATQAPESVPRPAIVPRAAEPAAPQASTEPAQRATPRRYVNRYHRRYANWQPLPVYWRSEEHTSELQSRQYLV